MGNPNPLMNEAEIQAWVLRRLRAAFWKVELTQDDLDDATAQARRWFSAKKGVKKHSDLNFYSGQVEYDLDDDVDVVLDIAFPVPALDISLVFSPYILQDEKVPYDVFAAPSSIGIYSSYTQTMQYIQQAKEILNAAPDWRQEDRKLLIFPIPRSNGVMRMDYKTHEFTIEQLHERDHDLVKRYALMLAKRDVGHTWAKYTEFPGAQGPTNLNWQRILEEADKEEEQLDKEIFSSALPMGFRVG